MMFLKPGILHRRYRLIGTNGYTIDAGTRIQLRRAGNGAVADSIDDGFGDFQDVA